MENMKLYKNMTVEEQYRWITDFTSYTEEKLPVLCALGDAWEASHIKSLEDGLKLLQAFQYCRDFVEKTLLFRDFSRRIDRVQFYVNMIKKEISGGVVMKGSNGQTMAYVPSLQPASRRRGRPTKEEAAAANSPEWEAEQKKVEAIAKLTGSVYVKEVSPAIPVTAAANPVATVAPLVELPIIQAINSSQGEVKLHIDQLLWLLSDALKEETKKIQGLRAVAANEAEQAKALEKNGVDSAVIEPHTRASAEAQKEYRAIYHQIDCELATLYVRLKEDNLYGGLQAQMEQGGSTLDSLLAVLLPYYEKLGGADFAPIATLGANTDGVAQPVAPVETPEQEELRKAKEALKSKELHNIQTYMNRKDLKPSANRIEKMKDGIEKMKTYGEDATEYEEILAKTVQELTEQEAAAAADKEAAKEAKQAAKTTVKKTKEEPKA